MDIQHTTDLTSSIYQDALNLRFEVFVKEQGVPAELEIEEENSCLHFVLYQEGNAVATCRLLEKDEWTYKLQRMAVSKNVRGLHLGQAIIAAAEKKARHQGYKKIILGAQNAAIGFYATLGYRIYGEEFMDAGIPHHMMEKDLH